MLVKNIFLKGPKWFSIWIFRLNKFIKIGIKKLMSSFAVVFEPGLAEQEAGFFLFGEFDEVSAGVGPFKNDSTLFDDFGSFFQEF